MDKKVRAAIVLLLIAGLLQGCSSISGGFSGSSATEDSLRFKTEYEALNDELNAEGAHRYTQVAIDKANAIDYLTYEELIDFICNQSGLLYFGRPGCPWCRLLIPIMLDYAKEEGVTIYYYDIEKDRTENSPEYQRILSLLGEYLPTDTVTQKEDDPDFNPDLKRVVLPQLFFLKEGKIRADLYLYEHTYLQNNEVDKVKQLLKGAYNTTASYPSDSEGGEPCDC